MKEGFDIDYIYEIDGSACEIWLDEPHQPAVCHARTKSTESFNDFHIIRLYIIHKVLHIPLHIPLDAFC